MWEIKKEDAYLYIGQIIPLNLFLYLNIFLNTVSFYITGKTSFENSVSKCCGYYIYKNTVNLSMLIFFILTITKYYEYSLIFNKEKNSISKIQ